MSRQIAELEKAFQIEDRDDVLACLAAKAYLGPLLLAASREVQARFDAGPRTLRERDGRLVLAISTHLECEDAEARLTSFRKGWWRLRAPEDDRTILTLRYLDEAQNEQDAPQPKASAIPARATDGWRRDPPPRGVRLLVTWKSELYSSPQVTVASVSPDHHDDLWFSDGRHISHVIAWMPAPAPASELAPESAPAPTSQPRPTCPRCSEHFSGDHLCLADHEEHCAIRASGDGWDADCSCSRGRP